MNSYQDSRWLGYSYKPENRLKSYDNAALGASEYFIKNVLPDDAIYFKNRMRIWFRNEYSAYIKFYYCAGNEIPVIMNFNNPEKEILFKLRWF